MKKLLSLLLAVMLLLTIAACGEDAPPTPKTTLEECDGWYERSQVWEDSLPGEIMHIDAASATATLYDEFYTELGSYPCRCDESGLQIDLDEPIGTVVYFITGSVVDDADGNWLYTYFDKLGQDMQVARRDFTLDDIVGTWYRDGDRSDYKLVVTDEVYYTEYDGEMGDEYPASVVTKSAESLGIDYEGSALEVDPFAGPFSFTLWILEDGRIMYDDFERRFWAKDTVTDDELPYLTMKMDVIRDAWCAEDGSVIEFHFDGTVKALEGDSREFERIGTWTLIKDVIQIKFDDGGGENIQFADEITVEALGKTYERSIEW